LPKTANPHSFPSEILAQESLKFYSHKLVFGKGIILYSNIFDSMSIIFSTFQNIEFEGNRVKNGELRISRLNPDANIWNPIVTRYDVKTVTSPLSVTYANETLKIKLKTKSYNTTSLKLKIFIAKQNHRPHLNLSPQNLSHRASFIEDDIIKWEIEFIHYGCEYSIKFTKWVECFKIERVKSCFTITDKLASGLFICKCNIKNKNSSGISKEFYTPIKYQSNIEETYFFGF
jgi:hypothetical protein